jgi:D-alanyl-D-alanine carboxypeptidase
MNNNLPTPFSWRKLLYLIPAAVALLCVIGLLLWQLLSSEVPVVSEEVAASPTVLTNFSDDLGTTSTLQFTTIELTEEDLSKGTLVLVNRTTQWPFLTDDTLETVYDYADGSYSLSGVGLQLQAEVIAPLNEMLSDYCRITGCDRLMLSEGYRSGAEQDALYNAAVEADGEEVADQFVAKSGYSEYHTGYGCSFSFYTEDGTVMDFTTDDDSDWLTRNCSRFGFVVRYPEGKSDITGYESQPYHFRYVGKPHSYLMGLKGYCLEEYLEYLSHYPFDGSHIQVTDNDNKTYEIYYVPSEGETTQVPVPAEEPYTISGDNSGGFIVTVALS